MTLEELLTYCVAQVVARPPPPLSLYDLVGQGFRLERRTGANDMERVQYPFRVYFETVGTFLFLVCILGVTQRGAPVELAGIAIGLTLAAIPLVGINISGSSVNPARSLGPAMVGYAHNPQALKQIWLYILAPLIGVGWPAICSDQACSPPKR